MNQLSKGGIFLLALLLVVGLGVIDVLVGLEISMGVFYLCPVSIASWYAGPKMGVLISLLSTFAAFAGKLIEGSYFIRPGISLWNSFLHLGFMLIVAYLVDRLHVRIENEHALARSDFLTGLLNRRAFLDHLRYRLELTAREGKPTSLAYIDLDDFKRINDEGGHEHGDKVLQLVAATLMESVRRTDLICRLGGDEFALLISDADQAAAKSLLAKVKVSLQQAFEREQSMVTCSIGCATFYEPLPSVDEAVRFADLLMYQAKKQGKNVIAFDVYTGPKGSATPPCTV